MFLSMSSVVLKMMICPNIRDSLLDIDNKEIICHHTKPRACVRLVIGSCASIFFNAFARVFRRLVRRSTGAFSRVLALNSWCFKRSFRSLLVPTNICDHVDL